MTETLIRMKCLYTADIICLPNITKFVRQTIIRRYLVSLFSNFSQRFHFESCVQGSIKSFVTLCHIDTVETYPFSETKACFLWPRSVISPWHFPMRCNNVKKYSTTEDIITKNVKTDIHSKGRAASFVRIHLFWLVSSIGPIQMLSLFTPKRPIDK